MSDLLHGEAAAFIGITPAALAARRRREGAAHPRHRSTGRTTLYDAEALATYVANWRDHRYAA